MSSLSISPETNYYTTINTFRTTPQNQAKVSAVLAQGMHLLDRQPGFIGTSVHQSYDGVEVVSYVQWESKEAFDAMRARPDAQEHFKSVGGLVTSVNTVACRVTQTHNKP
jgi:heme-degrading monooxygenase HmoA